MADKEFTNVIIKLAFDEASSDVTVTGGNNHASNIDGNPTEQDLALALGKIQNWFNNWHSVVWTGDAAKVNGKTVETSVPPGAVFTDTTYSLSGAYGTGDDTYVVTLTPSSGSATTATVPKATTSAFGITKLSSSTSSESTTLAATPSAVKSAYDLAAGKSVVTFSQALSSGTKIGTLTIDSTDYDLFCNTAGTVYSAGTGLTLASGNVFNHSNSVTAVTTFGMFKLKYDATGHITDSTAITKSDITALGIPESDTTYTFAEGSTNGTFTVTSGSTTTPISIHGLSSAAYAATTDFTAAKPDGTHDLVDSTTHLINTEYLPSYVDDVIEGYYNSGDGKFYKNRSGTSPSYTYSDEITGESGKIYLDIGATPAEAYRWGGSAYASLKQPTISAIADIVYKSNGVVTKSYTDGTASADVTVYTHPTTAGNKHIPSGGSAGDILGYGGSSGTASWVPMLNAINDFTGATSSAAGTRGTVPAPAQSTYNASGNRHYLRSDGTWSDAPVTTADTLILHVVAASSS